MTNDDSNHKLIPLSEVVKLVSISQSTIRRLELAGDFPRRKQISPRRVGWLRESVVRWAESRREV